MSTSYREEKIKRRINAIYGCACSLFLATKQRLLKALEATAVCKIDNNLSSKFMMEAVESLNPSTTCNKREICEN
jgi:hypothetical protein